MNGNDFKPLRSIRLGPVSARAPREVQGGGAKGGVDPTSGGPAWVPAVAVMQAWSQVVRGPLSEHARPCAWSCGVLRVEVDEPRWRHRLETLVVDLCARINNWLGCRAVQEIRIEGGEATRG